MMSDSLFNFQLSKTEEFLTLLSAEEPDETIFSILNFDHDKFLLELNEVKEEGTANSGLGHLNLDNAISVAVCDAPQHELYQTPSPQQCIDLNESHSGRHSTKLSTEINPERCAAKLEKSAGNLNDHSLNRISNEAKNGRFCGILRANINGLRYTKQKAASPSTSSCAAVRAAGVVQAAWRGFVFRHAFLHLRHIVRGFAGSSPRAALQAVNPREAVLADSAADIVVRFRLAVDDSSPLPFVVYKVFTRRPVVDVCRGCCGRLLKCANIPAATGSAPSSPCARACVESRPHSACCLLFASYRRVERNAWRPCSVGLLFSATSALCPARARRWLPRTPWTGCALKLQPIRSKLRRQAASVVGSGAGPGGAEKERQNKIATLRKLYGYQQEMGCPPPTANDSRADPAARAAGLRQPNEDNKEAAHSDNIKKNSVVVHTASAGDGASQAAVLSKESRASGGPGGPWSPGDDGRRAMSHSFQQAGDAYYSRLLSGWGL